MPVYVLTETPAGYGVFESSDKKLLKRNDLPVELQKTEKVLDILKLKSFTQYGSAAIALEEAAALAKGTVPPLLSSLLEEMGKEAKATVAVADMKLANAISQVPQFDIKAVAGSNLGFLYRAIREHLTSLTPDMTFDDYDRLVLGLGHSVSRHKIKFSADKIDSMVCHTVKTLDDLDRETNVFAMRLKEWYNWHFPELFKLLNDNLLYARVILAAGRRPDYADADLAEILTDELETTVQEAATRSMGTDLGDGDLETCRLMAGQVIKFTELRRELSSYLESRMQAIAPNLTALVGYLVGARLIAHVGTVTGLAKSAASTIQILGAEKALFRALKTKHDTPKYGLIYHSSLVGQATGKNKGKIARKLAAKAALGVRVDALAEDNDEDEDYEQRAKLGLTNRLKLENQLRKLEGRPKLPSGVGIGPDGQVLGPGQLTLRETRRYNADADGVSSGAAVAKDKANGAAKKSGKLVEVVESKDVEMVDGEEEDEEMGDAPCSPTLAPVSDDTEDESDDNADRKTKKARKKEQRERRAEREERRQAKSAQDERRAAAAAAPAPKTGKPKTDGPKKLSADDYERLAAEAGISVKKFIRKYERGDVEVDEDGVPVVHSKKELKKLRKAEEKPVETAIEELSLKSEKKKRKHADVADEGEDDGEGKKAKKVKKEKKEKKKSKA